MTRLYFLQKTYDTNFGSHGFQQQTGGVVPKSARSDRMRNGKQNVRNLY